MTDDLHSCSYYCDRIECIKRQRDELREKLSVEECLVREWHDRYTTQVMTSEKLTRERDEWRKLVMEHNSYCAAACRNCREDCPDCPARYCITIRPNSELEQSA